MKLKKLLISLAILTASVSAHADAGAFVVGVLLGSVLTQPQTHHVYVQPSPQIIYQQPAVVINPSQVPYYDPNLHGYCAPYSDELYAQCMGNAKRNQLNNAYQRGLRGY